MGQTAATSQRNFANGAPKPAAQWLTDAMRSQQTGSGPQPMPMTPADNMVPSHPLPMTPADGTLTPKPFDPNSPNKMPMEPADGQPIKAPMRLPFYGSSQAARGRLF